MKKWRNKITGEINEFMVHKRIEDSEDGNPVYAPFDGHIDDWEDYEEPKEYWYYDTTKNDVDKITHLEDKEKDQAIGNYFETKEEAEKAVEKLKAWKRLKDKGFKFEGWNVKTAGSEGDNLLINLYVKDCTECEELLDLLFGGEE